MLHVTEDTPPDMLAGAMDLIVHLPTSRSIKMSVERSTPMMDLLVQITTNNQLQLSNYTLQALGMAPSAGHGDKILPYKPNTPIGTLDTQHVRVVAKSRTLPAVKAAPPFPGQLPFESTFRLKVHLPRNQLFVTRVSRNVQLEDIMKKVCEEKNLDPVKYELKHPANLDEILDPKATLCDYQITEIYVVSKATISLNQAFSTSDIMALRKEEERKQMHNKTGGGVFNLIFRRGKSSMGSGSISSDTRSISPTHSDDSRSVTPPGIQQPILTPPPKKDVLPERPKPPLRKRRPAPKPPQAPEVSRTTAEDARTAAGDARDNGMVICHSRNSSDSSGYHEASVLSEHCNATLPRRPKSALVGTGEGAKMHSRSVTNLSKMAAHSKSTTSLGMTGRKKKAAPPPPPAFRTSNPSVHLEAPIPIVASQTAPAIEAAPCTSQDSFFALSSDPVPFPRSKSKAPPVPAPRSDISRRLDLGNEANVGNASGEETSLREVPNAPKRVNGEESLKELQRSSKEETSRQVLYHATEIANGKESSKELSKELKSLDRRESSEQLNNVERGVKQDSCAATKSLNGEESRQELNNARERFNKESSKELIPLEDFNEEESRQELYDAAQTTNGKESLKELPKELESLNERESSKELLNMKRGFNEEDSKQDLCDATKSVNGEESRQELGNTRERFNKESSKELIPLEDFIEEESRQELYDATQTTNGKESLEELPKELESLNERESSKELLNMKRGFNEEDSKQDLCDATKNVNGEESSKDSNGEVSLNELCDATKGFNGRMKDCERQSTPGREVKVLKPLLNGNGKKVSSFLWGRESSPNKEVEGPESPAKELEKLQMQLQHNLFTSSAFKPKRKVPVDAIVASAEAPSNSNDKKLPEVVGVIPKTPEKKPSQSKFDTFGKRRLQNLASLTAAFDDESKSLHSRSDENKSNSMSSRTSLTSALGSLDCIDDDLSDLDENVFSRTPFGKEKNVFDELCGFHDLDKVELGANQSISSVKSLRSLQGFVSSGMRKWYNSEELDRHSLASLGPCGDGRWVVGDSEPASLTSHQTLDSLPSSDLIPDASEAPRFGSTDSGIATEKLEEEEAGKEVSYPLADLDWHYELPSPPRAFRDASPAEEDSKDSVVTSPELFERLKTLEDERTRKEDSKDSVVTSPELFERLKTLEDERTRKEDSKYSVVTSPELFERLKTSEDERTRKEDSKDSVVTVPELFERLKTSEDERTRKEDSKDSVVTVPELFEKLKTLEGEQTQQQVSKDSVVTSPKLVAKLETLEDERTRKEDSKDSVVTVPELFAKPKTLEGGQIQQQDSEDSVVTTPEPLAKLKTSEEEQTQPLNTLSLEKLERRQSMVYQRVLSGLRMAEEVGEEGRDSFSGSLSKFESTLAEVQTRFAAKATQQTLPNFKISTYDRPKQKIKVFEDDTVRSNSDKPAGVLQRYPVGRSTETISARKNSAGSESTKPDGEFRPTGGPIRSESFSQDDARGPARPVSRSKSHLTLDGAAKYRVDRRGGKEEGVSRCNSLYDVSGLQSLGVMRLIQTKLNTPAASMENLAPQEKICQPLPRPEPPQQQSPPPKPTPHSFAKPSAPDKVYKYSGPPTVNMSTWSERPKAPVSVARDRDPPEDARRFFTPTGYRKPERPRSVAADLDTSRLPVVRSVELKKPFGAPVVRGFQAVGRGQGSFATNCQVPFGQGTLRRTESSKVGEGRPVANERDQLLSAIRNFGGKKGLRAVRAA